MDEPTRNAIIFCGEGEEVCAFASTVYGAGQRTVVNLELPQGRY